MVQEGLGPCRSGTGLRRFLEALEEWKASFPSLKAEGPMDLLHALEMKGLTCTAEAVARAALLREESRGVHFREDFPEEREELKSRILVSSVHGKPLPRGKSKGKQKGGAGDFPLLLPVAGNALERVLGRPHLEEVEAPVLPDHHGRRLVQGLWVSLSTVRVKWTRRRSFVFSMASLTATGSAFPPS